MAPEFSLTPAEYRAESQQSSRFWNLWFPVAVFIIIPIWSYFDSGFFGKWMASETHGLLEFLHAFLPLITALIGLRLLFSRFIRTDPFLIFWSAAIFIGGIYLAGEEASWGQHYVGWVTPEGWTTVNDQQETNLHNVSNLLDQLPRAILQAGIVLTGIVYPWILLNRPGWMPARYNFTYPPLALVPIGLLIAACWIYRALDQYPPTDDYFVYRSGEFQEIFIVWYLFYYTLFLLMRDRKMRKVMQDGDGSA